MAEITVLEIVSDFLKLNGYDGLYNPGECGCSSSNLFPCDEDSQSCIAGYIRKCKTCSDDIKETCELEGKDDPDGYCMGNEEEAQCTKSSLLSGI